MAVPPTSPSDKRQLRIAMRALRTAYVAGLSVAEREAAERALAERVAPLLAGHERIASYQAIGAEIEPCFLSRHPRGVVGDDPWSIAYPRVRGRDASLTFHAAAAADMVPGWSNILEPHADAPLIAPTALLVPLLAVDARGNRLGYGAGHYDRTLAELGSVLKIGLAWDCQVVDALPAEPWDVPLDWIATPTRLIRCDSTAIGLHAPTR